MLRKLPPHVTLTMVTMSMCCVSYLLMSMCCIAYLHMSDYSCYVNVLPTLKYFFQQDSPNIQDLHLSMESVKKLLEVLNPHKASDLDLITCHLNNWPQWLLHAN